MASFNQVTLVGNLTRDPELRYTPKGTAIAKIGMAINRGWTTDTGEKKEEVTFVDVDVFGRTAEAVGQYLRKGSSVLIAGRLRLAQWEDKQTGQKKSRLGVVAEQVQFLNSKPEGGSRKPEAAGPPQAAATEAEAPQANPPEMPPTDDDDVPF